MKERVITLREKIEDESLLVFDPIFGYEDDTLAAYCPLDGKMIWRMDLWGRYIFDKYRELKSYFTEEGLQFMAFERFCILSLERTFEHEIIHSQAGNVTEAQMDFMIRKLYVGRLIEEIILAVKSKIHQRLSNIRVKELIKSGETGYDVMLERRGKKKNV